MIYGRNSQFKFIILIISALKLKKQRFLTLKPIDFQSTGF